MYFLPQGYKNRKYRLLIDADPAVAWEGWEDEHWDGSRDAHARPGTLRYQAVPDGDRLRIQPLGDSYPTVMSKLEQAARMREKRMLRETVDKRILTGGS